MRAPPSQLLDVTNPSHLNIEGVKKTQLELNRATAIHAPYVDEQLREAVRRLMGHGQPLHISSKTEAQEARAICAEYLDTRIQDKPEQKPGRKPDMSTAAAQAFKAVLQELASTSVGASALMRRPSVSEVGVRAIALAGQLEILVCAAPRTPTPLEPSFIRSSLSWAGLRLRRACVLR